ncbi:MAG: SUMF1/EgtB/PvdO family nonheme iron enzyme [Gammaproteobacteria bacterium]
MIRYFNALLVSGLVTGLGVAWGTPAIDGGFSVHPETSFIPENDTGWTQIAGIIPKDSEAVYELEFWNSIKDSKDASDYEAYLEAYPNGRFAPLARARAKRYKKASGPAQPVQQAQPSQPVQPPALKIEAMDDRYEARVDTNVREKPSSSARKIGELASKSSVQVTGRLLDKEWYRVRLPGGGTGYVYAPLLSKPSPKPKTETKPQPIATKTATPALTNEKATHGKAFKDCPTCPEMVSISPGQFVMGSAKGDPSERPAHRVTLSSPFAIGKFEVTVAQWKECVKANGCRNIPAKADTSDNAPIHDVSWNDAQAYVKWLSGISGQKYRLPTEAEWEYAARGGTTSTYWWGDKIIAGKANCKDCGNNAWDPDKPADVGTFDANAYGIYDMNGNVWEWVNDCWHKNYKGAPANGTTWEQDNCRVRVIRGGSWRNDKSYIHSASRFKYDAYVRYILNGFRVAKPME